MSSPLPCLHLLVCLSLCGGLYACDGSSGAPKGSVAPAGLATSAGADVVATVNGVPIRQPDLYYVLSREDRGRGAGADQARVKAALEEIIAKELARQEAEALGLDANPEYEKKLRFMEAPVNDFKRTELSERFFRRQVVEKAQVDAVEARKYFDEHRDRFRSEVRVSQILVKGDLAKITELKKEIDGGAPFEAVAAKQFTALPPDAPAPWDLGVLRWQQVPEQWRPVLDAMKEGEVSDIIRGPNERYWLIKLVERRVNEAITFEQVQADLTKMLTNARAAELGEKTAATLRKKATIVYVGEPAAMPPPPDPGD